MEVLQRFFRTIHYNSVLYAIAAVAFLYTLTSPMIAEPILNFCFAGIVPGTDIVISPDVIIMSLAIIAGLAAVVALLSWLLYRRRQGRLIVAILPTAQTAVTAGTSPRLRVSGVPDKVSKQGSRTASRQQNGLLDKLAVLVNTLAAAAMDVARYTMYGLSLLGAALQLGLLRILRVTVAVFIKSVIIAIIAARWLVFVSRIAADGCWLAAVRLNRWLYPKVLRWDSWLEIQYRTVSAWLRRTMLRLEMIQVAADIVRVTKISMKEIFRQR